MLEIAKSLGLLKASPSKLSTTVSKTGSLELEFETFANLLSPCWQTIIFPSLSIAKPLAPNRPCPKLGAYPVLPLGEIYSEAPFSSFHLNSLLFITSTKRSDFDESSHTGPSGIIIESASSSISALTSIISVIELS